MYPASAHTVCIVGADVEIVERIDTILRSAPDQLHANWQLAAHAEAHLLIIDTESLYGHMDWLKTQSSRRLAVAYTDGPDTIDSEFVLRKPIDTDALIATLNRVGVRLRDETPVELAAVADATAHPRPEDAEQARVAEAIDVPTPVSTLASLLTMITRPTRLAGEGLPAVFLDPRTRTWHCAQGLKAVAAWCHRTLAPGEVRPLGEGDFAAAVAHLPAQPYSRLHWIGELTRHAGTLAPGLDPSAHFRLSRWPQSEREFPRHFRIATVMLKQAATPDEIATQSGAPAEDVNDFINAYHALGFIEQATPAPRQPEPGRAGLFARMRKASAN